MTKKGGNGLNDLNITLTKSHAFSKDEVKIQMQGGSKEERARVLQMAEDAVLNGWMSEIEETKEETDSEQQA